MTLALACVVGAIAGCVTVAGQQGNPAAPVVVTGKVIDAARRPIGGATLDLSVTDDEAAAGDGTASVVYHEVFTSSADGSFAIRLAPTQALVAFAARHGNVLQFDLLARSPAAALAQGYGFAREVLGAGWAGQPPSVVITPAGVEGPAVAPGPPVAQPVAT